MASLIIYVIGAVFSFLILLFILYHCVVYPVRTYYYRRSAGKGARCKFYLNDESRRGTIQSRMGDRVEVVYYDYDAMTRGKHSMHVKELYPLL